MWTIWKYTFDMAPVVTLKVPIRGHFLPYIEADFPRAGTMTVWYEHDNDSAEGDRTVFVVGTGTEIPGPPAEGKHRPVYVGTARASLYVWHLYDGGVT